MLPPEAVERGAPEQHLLVFDGRLYSMLWTHDTGL